MLVVGERINSSRKTIGQALCLWDEDLLQREAAAQAEAGAHLLDVNCGTLVDEEEEMLPRLVQLVQAAVSLELCLDSPNPRALERALEVHRGRALVNSITGQKARWEAMVPLLREWKPRVVVLCLSDQGIPGEVEARVDLACRLVDGLVEEGMDPGDLYVDPVVQPLCTQPQGAVQAVRTLWGLKSRVPEVRTIGGVSNVSFGLPARPLVNRTYLAMLLGAGLDAGIIDPLDESLMHAVLAARALRGDDCHGMDLIRAYRQGQLARG